MKRPLILLTLLTSLSSLHAQGAIIKASMQMFIADRTQSDPVYEPGQGYLIFNTEDSLLLGFYAESESYVFSMLNAPLFVYWDVHLYPDNPVLSYNYGGGNGGAQISRRAAAADDVDCVFQFYGEAQTIEFDDNFNVLFESGDGFMDFWVSAPWSTPAPDFEISLDIPSSEITRLDLHSVPEPAAWGLFSLALFALGGNKLTRQKRDIVRS